MSQTNFLIGRGELLTHDIKGPKRMPGKAEVYSFAQAVQRLTPQFSATATALDALPSPALSSAVARRSAKCASTFSCETAGRRSSKTSCTLARNQASCAAASTVAPKLSSMAAARSFPSASMRVCTSAFATIVASK